MGGEMKHGAQKCAPVLLRMGWDFTLRVRRSLSLENRSCDKGFIIGAPCVNGGWMLLT